MLRKKRSARLCRLLHAYEARQEMAQYSKDASYLSYISLRFQKNGKKWNERETLFPELDECPLK